MSKQDGRKIDRKTLEWIRTKAVKDVVQRKKSPEEVIRNLGMHRSNIYAWLKKHAAGGYKKLKSTKAKGAAPRLNTTETKQLQKWLLKNPRQFAIHFGLWTINLIQKLVHTKFKKSVDGSTISRFLKKIGYTCQKPLRRAYEQNPTAVEKWKTEEYPKILKEAKRQHREIYFSDESGFRSTGASGKTWAKKGQRPIVRTTGKRYGINAISAVSSQGSFRFSLYEGSFTGETFLDFLKKLVDGSKKPISLIVDGHPVHKRKLIQDFVKSTKGKLKLYFLPAYSPELNPDEQVWQHAKSLIRKVLPQTKMSFVTEIRACLHRLHKLPKLVKSFFSHPDVGYLMQV